MTPSFETALAAWHDFYILVGTGAFTLIGLMFVAVTFGAHLLDEKNMALARAFLDPVVVHFVEVLVIAGIVLMPGMEPPLFGGLLAAIGALSLMMLTGVHRGLRTAQSQYNDMEMEDWLSGFLVPLGVYIGFAGCGVAFWMGQSVFGALAVLTLIILLNSIYAAWELILWFAAVRTKQDLRKRQVKKR
jgi:hypothetical protein